MNWKFKIIKKETLDQLNAALENEKKACTELQAKYLNLHRLHEGLWKKYQSELSESDDRINELQAELRKSEHQRKELEKKLKKYETRRK